MIVPVPVKVSGQLLLAAGATSTATLDGLTTVAEVVRVAVGADSSVHSRVKKAWFETTELGVTVRSRAQPSYRVPRVSRLHSSVTVLVPAVVNVSRRSGSTVPSLRSHWYVTVPGSLAVMYPVKTNVDG